MSDFDRNKIPSERIDTLIRSAVLAKGDEGELRKIIMLAAQAGWYAAGDGAAEDDVPDGALFRGGMDAATCRRATSPSMAFDARAAAGLPGRRARHV